MTVRGFTAGTQRGYIRAVGASATSMNSAVSALRFFFGVTLGPERCAGGDDDGSRAAQAAGDPEPAGGHSSLGRGPWAQVPGSVSTAAGICTGAAAQK